MKNKVGFGMFAVGFLGTVIMGCALDSPGDGWKIAVAAMLLFLGVAAAGYRIMDVEEVLEKNGVSIIREPRKVRERKRRNREQTFRNWIRFTEVGHF